MRFDTKIAIVVRDDLALWQRLNLTAFLASGIAALHPAAIGDPYRDASGQAYAPMFMQPVVIYAAEATALTAAFRRARERELPCAIYTQELFTTDNDADNRAAVAAIPTEALMLVGFAARAPRNAIDKVVKGLALHR